MIHVEHSDTIDHPAATVFAVLIDIQARPTWQPSISEERIEPTGPARLGSRIVEIGTFAGHRSEKTLTVTEFEQDRRLTLETAADARAPFRERYEIVPLADGACRLICSVEIGGVPRIAEFLVRQATTKELPRMFARLKAVLDGLTLGENPDRMTG